MMKQKLLKHLNHVIKQGKYDARLNNIKVEKINVPDYVKDVIITVLNLDIGIKESLFTESYSARMIKYHDCLRNKIEIDICPPLKLNDISISENQIIKVMDTDKYIKKIFINHSLTNLPEKFYYGISICASNYLKINQKDLSDKLRNEVKNTIHFLRE